jgi:hypothetical protein
MPDNVCIAAVLPLVLVPLGKSLQICRQLPASLLWYSWYHDWENEVHTTSSRE